MSTNKGQRVDLGLAISGATLRPGQTRSLLEIAAYCDCSIENISYIERNALRKLRHPARIRQLAEAAGVNPTAPHPALPTRR